MKKLFTLLMVLLMTSLCGPALWSGAAPISPNAQAKGGRKAIAALFETQCAKCHSSDGKGLESLQPPDFTDPKWQSSRTNKQLTNGIINGVGIMPGFKGALKPAEVAAMVRYVRAFGPAK
ncbi:MAG: c-type cytochrome [Blastocatellia bacterium]